MAFTRWQIGLHIQQDVVLSVALSMEKKRWRVRRWWRIPLADGIAGEGQVLQPSQLCEALKIWQQELPHNHEVRLAFPAIRTLQRTFPRPEMVLRESEQTAWIGSSIARELGMNPENLCFDYTEDRLRRGFRVTAAQNKEMADLLNVAQTLDLRLTAITPDACALQRLLSGLAPPQHCLVWQGQDQWLWATQYLWGRVGLSDATTLSELSAQIAIPMAEIALCSTTPSAEVTDDGVVLFDPWQVVSLSQPPIPADGAAFAIAIGLALGTR